MNEWYMHAKCGGTHSVFKLVKLAKVLGASETIGLLTSDLHVYMHISKYKCMHVYICTKAFGGYENIFIRVDTAGHMSSCMLMLMLTVFEDLPGREMLTAKSR